MQVKNNFSERPCTDLIYHLIDDTFSSLLILHSILQLKKLFALVMTVKFLFGTYASELNY